MRKVPEIRKACEDDVKGSNSLPNPCVHLAARNYGVDLTVSAWSVLAVSSRSSKLDKCRQN